MAETKFTPGPWTRHDTADYAEIHPREGNGKSPIALVGTPEDADLIAAAPALYEALEALAKCEIDDFEGVVPDSDIVRFPFTIAEVRAARAALSLARGEKNDV